MAVTAAAFVDAAGHITATIDGVVWSGILLSEQGQLADAISAWVHLGNTVTPFAMTKADLHTYAENRARAQEAVNVTVLGHTIPTDRESQAKYHQMSSHLG